MFLALAAGLTLAVVPAAQGAPRELRSLKVVEDGPGITLRIDFSRRPGVKVLESGNPRSYILAFPNCIYRETRSRTTIDSPLASRVTLSQHDRRTVWMVLRREPSTRVSYQKVKSGVQVVLAPPASGFGPTTPLRFATAPGEGESPPSAAGLIPTRAPGKKPRIVIDAGHGGRDPGAVGKHTTDKAVALKVARYLKEHFDEDDSLEVHYTRLEDRFVRLEDRAALARRVGADLFVSLHANSGPRSVRGYEVWYLSLRGSRRLVRREARRATRDSQDPVSSQIDRIRLDLLRETNLNKSSLLAGFLNHALKRTGQRSRGVHHADFAVLRSVNVPSVLLELGFLSHAEEGQQLMDPEFLKKQARCIYEGLRSYLQSQGRLDADGDTGPLHYPVQPGDSLSVIAVRFGVDLVDLADANGITKDSTLIIGRVLRIPRDPVASLIGEHIE